eukprot:gene39-1742_t
MAQTMMKRFWILAILAASVAASERKHGHQLPSMGPCDPLVEEFCALPYPNNFYLRNGTGHVCTEDCTVQIPKKAWLKNLLGVSVDLDKMGINGQKGFSTGAYLIAYFGESTTGNHINLIHSGVATWKNISLSVQPNSPSVLLDTSTGEMVAHWAEVDIKGGTKRPVLVHPAEILKPNTRYIMAFRNLVWKTGETIPANKAMKAYVAYLPFIPDPVVGQ